jgi:hypothetical protein
MKAPISAGLPLKSCGPASTNNTSTQAFHKVSTYGAIIEKTNSSNKKNMQAKNPVNMLLMTN